MKAWCVFIVVSGIILSGCAGKPPTNPHNICSMFKQYPRWYRDAKDVEKRWLVPVPVQMAIIYQESGFKSRAKPRRQKLFHTIPWKRPSTAYGYSQALNGTWSHYKQGNGGIMSSRTNFDDAVDFIGWYANDAHKRARISRGDAYSLYLAYHEGVGGYMRKTYLKKPWLIQVAKKVQSRASVYRAQLRQCM